MGFLGSDLRIQVSQGELREKRSEDPKISGFSDFGDLEKLLSREDLFLTGLHVPTIQTIFCELREEGEELELEDEFQFQS